MINIHGLLAQLVVLVIGTTQSITVSNVGTYYVHNTALAPCVSIDETITVEPFGTTSINPVIPFADETVTCPNDGKLLPNIYLCGDNAKRYISSGVTDTNSIIWEKSSCAASKRYNSIVPMKLMLVLGHK